MEQLVKVGFAIRQIVQTSGFVLFLVIFCIVIQANNREGLWWNGNYFQRKGRFITFKYVSHKFESVKPIFFQKGNRI